MATNPIDGLYYEFHIPLGLKELVEQLIVKQPSGRNSLALTGGSATNRQWFSQPRPAIAGGRGPRIPFFYITGTDYFFEIFGIDYRPVGDGEKVWVPGTAETTEGGVYWDGTTKNDPFPYLLDPDVWSPERIAVAGGTGLPLQQQSIEEGVLRVIAAIKKVAGPFGLGGFSTGAIVASRVYDEIRNGSLQNRRSDLVAGVTFGNPVRQTDHTWPAATWSGSWDTAGSTTGGHGCFPAPQRLANAESLWWDFVNENDIVAAVGDSAQGLDQQAVTKFLADNYPGGSITRFLEGWTGTLPLGSVAAIQNVVATLAGVGAAAHASYATTVPPGNPQRGLTSYQIALNHLNEVGAAAQSDYKLSNATEVISVRFKIPLSVSEISFDVLRVPCEVEVWYQDRQNNWRPMLTKQRGPVTVTVAASNSASWYAFHTQVYPIIARAVQIRITRIPDSQIGSSPYVVGIKNTLIRRNVYDRSQGKLPFEEEQDVLGNVISKYVKDWEPSQAIDNNPYTFWRSAPMPDHQAVCNLYLDTRNYDGTGQLMDGIFLDPVYANQTLNIYYSNDDEPGERKLSSITLRPQDPPVGSTDEEDLNDLNTDWRSDRGRWDTATGNAASRYRVPVQWGPLINKNLWVGIEWTPAFSAENAPANNPVLLQAVPTTNVGGRFAPTIFYDVGAQAITLQFTDGSSFRNYSAAFDTPPSANEPLRIVVGWSYGPDTVYISVANRRGEILAELEEQVPRTSPTLDALPGNVTLDGTLGFSNFRGLFTAHIVKQEHWEAGAASFQANPVIYTNPDPVIPNDDGSIPSTTLDNALYAADWTLQAHGTGGSHESFYTAKSWRPIWRDYLSQRGRLFFPETIAARYLKLEFSNLTEESYPVYDAGIQVTYQVFPIAVQQQQTVKHPGLLGVVSGLMTVGAQTLVGGLGTVNWLNPQTVATAINSVFGPVVSPVQIQVGAGYVTSSIPGTAEASVASTVRSEISSPYVYRRGLLDPKSMAANHIYYSGFTTWSQTLSNANDLIGNAIQDAFTPLRNFVANPTAGPVQGRDWWIFPGGTLKMPAAIMNGLTALTQTVLGRKPTTETRMRFMTESVHRYETRTLTRDAAVAYFAGVREVQPLITTHLVDEDPAVFKFTTYHPSTWTHTNTRILTEEGQADEEFGPTTTAGRIYTIPNPNFDLGLSDPNAPSWIIHSGTWAWDNGDFSGRWYPGAAKATATGVSTQLFSPRVVSVPGDDVAEGQHITFNAYVKWADLVVANNQPGIQLGLIGYDSNDDVVDDTIVLDGLQYSDWSLHQDNEYVQLSGTWTVPADIVRVRIRLVVTEHATAGDVWFDSVTISSADDVIGSVYQSFSTTSKFAKVRCEFTDSKTVMSDRMWANIDPNNTNIDNQKLAYYTSFISLDPQGATWSDSFANWGDTNIAWGSPDGLVTITIDPDRTFDNQRVLHMRRGKGAGRAGVKVRQWTNFVSGGLFRICARWFKPRANGNTISVKLRRVSDGVVIYEEEILQPAVGYWHEFATGFKEIPVSADQVYTVELTTVGDAEDEIYLSDLWVEISHVRYFIRLGGEGAFLHDVTDLRYADTAIVSCPVEVNDFSIEARILTPRAAITGCVAKPYYLR